MQADGSSEDQNNAGGEIEQESLLASVESEGLGGEVISTDAHKSFWDKLTRVARGAANTGGQAVGNVIDLIRPCNWFRPFHWLMQPWGTGYQPHCSSGCPYHASC